MTRLIRSVSSSSGQVSEWGCSFAYLPMTNSGNIDYLSSDFFSVRDLCACCLQWLLRHLPDRRGRGAEGIVPRDSTTDRRTAHQGRPPSVATGGRMRHHYGTSVPGCCKNGQIAGSDVFRDGGNPGSTAHPAYASREPLPPAIVHQYGRPSCTTAPTWCFECGAGFGATIRRTSR